MTAIQNISQKLSFYNIPFVWKRSVRQVSTCNIIPIKPYNKHVALHTIAAHTWYIHNKLHVALQTHTFRFRDISTNSILKYTTSQSTYPSHTKPTIQCDWERRSEQLWLRFTVNRVCLFVTTNTNGEYASRYFVQCRG